MELNVDYKDMYIQALMRVIVERDLTPDTFFWTCNRIESLANITGGSVVLAEATEDAAEATEGLRAKVSSGYIPEPVLLINTCKDCGTKIVPTAVRCRECAQKQRLKDNEVKASGLFPCVGYGNSICSKNVSSEGRMCGSCAAKKRWAERRPSARRGEDVGTSPPEGEEDQVQPLTPLPETETEFQVAAHPSDKSGVAIGSTHVQAVPSASQYKPMIRVPTDGVTGRRCPKCDNGALFYDKAEDEEYCLCGYRKYLQKPLVDEVDRGPRSHGVAL